MMYPNLDAKFMYESDRRGNSNFEANCNHIFMKGPALTKEILGKVNAEIVPKKTYLFGYEFKTHRILLIIGLCLLFSVSFFGGILIWFTNAFDNFVLSQMVIKNDSDAFKVWKNPPVTGTVKMHIFNYTNVEEYEQGFDDKLNLEELGPYSFEAGLEKVDISFLTDETISFRDNYTLKFRQDLSRGSPNDKVVVPNLSVISASAFTKDTNYFSRIALSAVLSSLGKKAFTTIEAGPLLTGYRDQLYDFAKNFLPGDTPEKLGILVPIMGENPMKFTINNGKRDLNKYGLIQKIDDRTEYDFYSGDSCNSISGTEGVFYPPTLVQKKKRLHYNIPTMCRRMPLVFDKEVTVLNGKVPAYQYVHPENIFDSVEENPENACFCGEDGEECSPKGVFNITKCSFGTPIFLSHPHFHRADPQLLKHFRGLKPNGDYKTYFNIHPTMGFSITLRFAMQINIQVKKAESVSAVDMFEDGMILPIAWMEGVFEDKDLSQQLVDNINLVTFTVPSIKLGLKYGSLLTSIITLASLVLVLRRRIAHVQRVLPDILLRSETAYYEAS